MTPQIESQIEKEMERIYPLANSDDYPEYPDVNRLNRSCQSAFITGARSGYELAIEENKKLRDALENIMTMVGSSDLSKQDWKDYDETKLLLSSSTTIEEGEIGKGFSRETVCGFVEWMQETGYFAGSDDKGLWYIDTHAPFHYWTTEQLLTEYLNSQK